MLLEHMFNSLMSFLISFIKKEGLAVLVWLYSNPVNDEWQPQISTGDQWSLANQSSGEKYCSYRRELWNTVHKGGSLAAFDVTLDFLIYGVTVIPIEESIYMYNTDWGEYLLLSLVIHRVIVKWETASTCLFRTIVIHENDVGKSLKYAIVVCNHVDRWAKNKSMYRVPTCGLFLTNTLESLFSWAHTYMYKISLWYLGHIHLLYEKVPYLECQPLVHGSESLSLLAPCSKPTALHIHFPPPHALFPPT